METWFTVEKIDMDTYAISEYKHWEHTHCYLLLGTRKALLIDTGLGVSDMKEIVKGITSLPIDVVSTHVHWDHIGGHKYFNNIGVYETEKDWLSADFPIPLAVVKANLLRESCEFPSDFSIDNYQIFQGEPSRVFHDGDMFDLGGRKVQVIHTPGHSPGHVCFYEQDRQYLYSGDLIYEGCLDAFYPTTDPVKFMESVKRVKELPLQRILPGHHRLNIPIGLLDEIDSGFTKLFTEGKLSQGKGLFSFENFQIHI